MISTFKCPCMKAMQRIRYTAALVVLSVISHSHSFQPSSSLHSKASTAIDTELNMKTIDSHLHVWANAKESKDYPYAPEQTPPPQIIDVASTDALLQQMSEAGVDGALIVQPINHKYDHRYVKCAIKSHPDKFKGMMLFDPSLNEDLAVDRLEELVLDGFVGVRFNPYLFDGKMSENPGAVRIFERCAALKVPIGIMCFKGIELHYDDIVALCKRSPETSVILDHFGFAAVDNQEQFDLVLALAKYNVAVKISALFRLSDAFPYDKVKTERFEPLLETFGADRLMFGTDFPYVTQEEVGYKGAVKTVASWLSGKDAAQTRAVMGGTAERYFGTWEGK
jgi:predicted TIM-barrel fold metal-dependent hydrolase